MNTDPFDQKVRALVASAVADAPPAKPLPADIGSGADAGSGTGSGVDGGQVVPFGRRRPGMLWAGIAAAAAAVIVGVVVLNDRDDDRRITAASTTVASTAPTTASTPASSSTVPAAGWPADLAVVIASDRGIERVTAEDGQAVVTRLDAPLVGGVAFEMPDGQIVSRDGLLDVSLIGEVLVVSHSTDNNPATPPSVVLVIAPDGTQRELSVGDRMTHGLDIYVGQVTSTADSSWTPLLITPSGVLDTEYWQQLGVAGPHGPNGVPARLFSVAPSGSTIGWVVGDQFVLADGRSFAIPEGSRVVEVDLTDEYVALTRGDGPGTIIDLDTGETYPAPAAGRLTISLRSIPETPGSTTTTGGGSTPSGATTDVVTAGPDGVWRVVDGVATQLTIEPMAFAVAGPDGSVYMQRRSGWGEWPIADTKPLIWTAEGGMQEFSPAGELGAWWRVHDLAVVAGHWTMLYEVQVPQDQGVESGPGELHAMQIDTGSDTLVAANFGGWESGSSRMHLAETGVVVGATYSEAVHSLGAYSVTGGDAGITPAALGLDDSYYDCIDCPHLFTISRDGSTLAWLDGSELVLWSLVAGAETERIELGAAVNGAINMELGVGFVLIDRWNDQAVDIAPAIVRWGASGTTVVEHPGTSAALASPEA